MRKPIKDIEKAKYYLDKMKTNLEHINHPRQKDFQIDALNSFITLVNSFESFLENKYKLKSVEGLLCARLYSMFYQSIVDYEEIYLIEVVRKLDDDINYPRLKKEALIHFLYSEEVEKNLELNRPITPLKEWEVMIDRLLLEFKQQMLWI